MRFARFLCTIRSELNHPVVPNEVQDRARNTDGMEMKTVFTCVALLIGCILFNVARAQDRRLEIDGFALNPKLGLYFSERSLGLAQGAELNLTANGRLFSLDYYRGEQALFMDSNLPERFNQVAFMVGGHKGKRLFRLQYQAGLSSIWGVRRSDVLNEPGGWLSSGIYRMDDFFTLGVAGKLGFKVVPLSFLAIGFDLQAIINSRQSVLMPMFSLELGVTGRNR